jgi:hypothetical protein
MGPHSHCENVWAIITVINAKTQDDFTSLYVACRDGHLMTVFTDTSPSL